MPRRHLQIIEGPSLGFARPAHVGQPSELVSHVSIGFGETHVTITNMEGQDIQTWTAVFGWSDLIPGIFPGIDAAMFARILAEHADRESASVRLPLIPRIPAMDSRSRKIRRIGKTLRAAIDEILDRTVDRDAAAGTSCVCALIIAAPDWLHPVIRSHLMDIRSGLVPSLACIP